MESKTIRLFTVAALPEGKEAVQGFLGELKDLFAREGTDLEIAGIAYNKRTAIRQLEITKPDVLLMDLMLPGLRSTEVLSYVSGTQPDVKILALTPGDPPHDRIIMAIQAGALGYVSKDAEPTEIFAAMKQVLRGLVYLPIDETYDVLQQAAPELVVSTREKRARFFQALVGLIPIAGIVSALTEFLWREYWGQIGVRVTDLGVDASSRVTEFLITLIVFFGILGPLLFIHTWIEMIGDWIKGRPELNDKISNLKDDRIGKSLLGRLLFSPWLHWFLFAIVVLTITIPLEMSGGKILTILLGTVVAAVLMAHIAGIERQLPSFLTLSKGKSKRAFIIVGFLLLVSMVVLSAEVFLLGPDLRKTGLHGFLAPKVLDLSARPVMIYDLDEKHKPLGALYLGGNADLYVLYDPCKKTVRFVPVGASRVEFIKEVKCPSD